MSNDLEFNNLLLCCDVTCSCRYLLLFRGKFCFHFQRGGLGMEAVGFPEKMLNCYQLFIILTSKYTTYILTIFHISSELLHVSMHLHHLQGV